MLAMCFSTAPMVSTSVEAMASVARILPAAVGVPLIVRTDTGARAAQPMSRQVDAPPAGWAAAVIGASG